MSMISQSETFWHQLQLFEAESRIADEVLARMQEDTVRTFRRPQHLRHKCWTAGEQVTPQVTHQPHGDHDDEPDSFAASVTDGCCDEKNFPLHESVRHSTSRSEIGDKMRFYLSGGAFSTEDPISAYVDLLYSDLDSSTAKVRFKKPERLREKCFTAAACFSPSSADDFLSALGSDCLTLTVQDSEKSDTDVDTTSSDHSNKPANTTVQGQEIKPCYSLRLQRNVKSRSEMMAESHSEKQSTRSGTAAPAVGSNAPESSALVQRVSCSEKPGCSRGHRKGLRSDRLETDGEAAENTVSEVSRKNGATRSVGSEHFPVKNRLRRTQNASGTAEHADGRRRTKSSPGQTGGKTGGIAACRQGRRKDQASTELAGLLLLRDSAPMTGGRVIRRRLRRDGRRVVSRTTNLLCSSCVHGLLRTECLLCASLKALAHTLAQKAQQQQPNSLRKVPVTHQWTKKRPGANKSLSDRTNQEHSAPPSNVSKQRKVPHPGKPARPRKKTSILEPAKQPAKQLSPQTQTPSSSTVGTTNRKRLKFSGLNNNSKLNQDSSSSKKRKVSATRGESSSQKERNSPAGKRPKLSGGEEEEVLKTEAGVHPGFMADSVMYSKHVSSVSGRGSSAAAFTSAKDVFSQLCRLEERSKDYDLGTLQTIMPLDLQPALGRRSTAVSIYSRKSHVGGVWKTILS